MYSTQFRYLQEMGLALSLNFTSAQHTLMTIRKCGLTGLWRKHLIINLETKFVFSYIRQSILLCLNIKNNWLLQKRFHNLIVNIDLNWIFTKVSQNIITLIMKMTCKVCSIFTLFLGVPRHDTWLSILLTWLLRVPIP